MIEWLNRQARLIKLRMGIREGTKTVPWNDSSNVSVPLTDGLIRRWRPGVASLILDAEPVAFFTAQEPDDFDAARAAEPFFHFLFLEEMQAVNPAVQLVDTLAWHGHVYTRQSWCYRTARQSRVVPVASLFPRGPVAYVEEITQAALAQSPGEDPPSPVEIIALRLRDEYDLTDPQEEPLLLESAARILNGEPYVKLIYRRIVEDRPDWQVISPLNVIVPQDQDPEDAEFFCIIHMLDEDALRGMAIDGHLPPDRVRAVLDQVSRKRAPTSDGSANAVRDRIRDLMDRRAGRSGQQSEREVGQFPIWEVYARIDIDGDGERERCVLWYAPDLNMPIALLDYVFPFDKWGITYYPFEGARRPIDNRGIADMVKSLQRIVNGYHNMRIDASQMLLAPVLLARQGGAMNWKESVQWRPGAIIPVTSTEDVKPLVHDLRILTQLLQEEQSHQRLAETYVGVFDATLTNLLQSSERRTAAEVNAIQGLSASIFGLDARIFQTSLTRSLNQIWNLWLEFGPSETYMRVTGEAPVPVKKSEIGRNFDIRAAGTPANTNRSFQIAALERAMQAIFSNPLVLQSGRVDFSLLVERWLSLLDHNLARAIIRPPEEAAAVQTILQAAQGISGAPAPPV